MTPKTCYDYADFLRNFFGVLTTAEDRTISCTMLNIFLFYLLFTYTFGFSFTIRLCGRLISVTPSIKSVHDLCYKSAYARFKVAVLIFKIKVPFSQIVGCSFYSYKNSVLLRGMGKQKVFRQL